MLESRGITVTGGEGLPPRVLLTNSTSRRGATSQDLRSLPVLCEGHAPAGSSAVADTNLLAVRGMGLHIVGKIPRSVGGHEYMFVAIDKFTKWVEVILYHARRLRPPSSSLKGLSTASEFQTESSPTTALNSPVDFSSTFANRWVSRCALPPYPTQEATGK